MEIMKFDRDKDGYAEVSCRVRGDGLHSVLKVLRHFQINGDIGHSYSSTLDDENSDYRMSVGWDGDGADGIKDLKVNGKKLTKQFDNEEMKMGKNKNASDSDLWACGQWRREEDDGLSVWDFQGVFNSEQRAIQACRGDNWFIWPVVVNAEMTEEPIEAPGGYYPAYDREARIASRIATNARIATKIAAECSLV